MPPPPRSQHLPMPLNPSAQQAAEVERMLRAGQFEQAAAAALAWAAKSPGNADAQHFASVTQHKVGNNERAMYHAQRAVGLQPANAQRHLSLARCLYLNMQPAQAMKSMEQAARLAPQDLTILTDFAIMLSGERQYTRALRVTDEALRLHPGAGSVLMNKASLLVSVGRVDEAFTLASQLAEAIPHDLYSRSLRCLIANYLFLSPSDLLRVHQDFGACLIRTPRPILPRPPRPPRTKLRLAIISSDMRAHSVTFFLEPLLEHIDRSRFEVHVYHTNKLEDSVTARLKRHADRWWLSNNPQADDIAREVIADTCDIMIDLCGHTQPQGMIAGSLRPAPVQVTWLGYPNTTGVREMDWRIVDSTTDPAPQADMQAIERLLRLDPCFLCYRPSDEAPPVAPLPTVDKPITFVSFNSLQKVNARVAYLWRRVLDHVPGSRLVLKMTNLIEPLLQQEAVNRLASWGLTQDRTTVLLSAESRLDHFHAYDNAHIALDTYPYQGTTTTCEALWMGVPVLTLAGDRHAARVGASLLTAVGVPELIATTDDEFVEMAAALVQDRSRLNEYRGTLRDRMKTSALCDGPGFARRFGAAMERIWSKRAHA